MRETAFDFSKLSIAPRIQLAEDLERNPGAGEPWEVVRARLVERLERGE